MTKIDLIQALAHKRTMHELEIKDEKDMYDGGNYKESVQTEFEQQCDYYSNTIDELF